MKSTVYLEGKLLSKNCYMITTQSFMALFTFNCFKELPATVIIVNSGLLEDEVLHTINNCFSFNVNFKYIEDCPSMIQNCKLPSVQVSEKSWCTSGLSSTVRHVLREKITTDENNLATRLLGFRKGCLQACAEVSIWTKFCEIEVATMVNDWAISKLFPKENIVVPLEICKFENHLKRPPITHNVLKKKQTEFGKEIISKDKLIALRKKKLNELPDLEHTFAEGTDFTLADIFIFVAFKFMFNTNHLSDYVKENFPLVFKWFTMIKAEEFLQYTLIMYSDIEAIMDSSPKESRFSIPNLCKDSLYKSDPQRYKPRWRAYTNQKDIDECTNKFKNISLKIKNDNNDLCSNYLNSMFIDSNHLSEGMSIPISKLKFIENIQWDNLPPNISVDEHLPLKRLERKKQQLENMALAIKKIAKPNNTIVDFCSGSGHLGILLAYLLPDCKIILIENKEESLNRAYKRVNDAKLKNIEFYQCNLDYFTGSFNIGVCLHACGVATDLVLQKCIRQSSSFVLCPCCYGSIQENHILNYPRSKIYAGHFNITPEDYYILCHSADQTHDEKNAKTEQGKLCMHLIDQDRLLYSMENNYKTTLCVMTPSTCTPKNHILIGILSG